MKSTKKTNATKGEQKVIDILTEAGIDFKKEVSFEDLSGRKSVKLRYDFGVFENGKLKCLIEYDGIQHFEFVKHFYGTKIEYQREEERDRKKNRYCLMHNIPLIRIPYWDYDILTFDRIFNEPSYRVKTKYHIDDLKEKRGGKR